MMPYGYKSIVMCKHKFIMLASYKCAVMCEYKYILLIID